MSNRLLSILFLLLLAAPGLLLSQHFPVIHYGIEEGLPDANVYHLLESRNGTILLATERGAVAFDGGAFRSLYSNERQDATGTIIRMFEDDSGKLWLGSHKNGVFNIEDNLLKATTIKNLTSKAIAVSDDCMFIDGDVILRIDLQTNSCDTFSMKSHEEQLIVGDAGELYLLELKQIIRLDCKGLSEVAAKSHDESDFISCSVETDGSLLIGAEGRVMEWRNHALNKVLDLPADFRPTNITKDASGRYWFSNQFNGLYVSTETGIRNLGQARGIEQATVTDILADSWGNIWVATLGMGVFRYYHTYLTNYDQSSGYEGGVVFRILPIAKDEALLACNNDLYYLGHGDLKAAGFRCCSYFRDIALQSNGVYHLAAHSKQGQLPDSLHAFGSVFLPFATYALSSSQGVSFSSYYAPRLQVYNNNTWKPVNRAEVNDVNRTNRILHIEEEIWIGTSKGLHVIDQNGAEIESWKSHLADESEEIKDLLEIGDSEIWALKDNEILSFDVHTKAESETQVLEVFPKAMNAFAVDDTKRLWIGTNSGVFCYQNGQLLTHLKASNGLPSDYVTQLALDFSGEHLLIGTNKGVSKLNIAGWSSHQEQAPELTFRQLLIDSALVAFNENNDPISLQDRSALSISISALQLGEAGPLQYRYLLDDREIRSTNDEVLTLSSLETGEHWLKVQAKTLNSEWSAPLKLKFEVYKPWYRSGYFIAFLAYVVLLLLFVILLRIQRKKHEQSVRELETRKEINDLQQRSLRALMRPHFSSNIIAAVRQSIRNDEPLAADTAMSQLAELMRSNLQMVRAETVLLKDEIAWLKTYVALEQFARRVNWQVEFHVDEGIDCEHTTIPPMLIQPFVENAIMHAMDVENPWLSVRFLNADGQCIIEVTDNGPGIDHCAESRISNEHVSMGTDLLQDRLQLMTELTSQEHSFSIANGRIQAKSFGTRVTVSVPLQKQL